MKTLLVSLFAFGVGVSTAMAQTPGGSIYSSPGLAYVDSSRCNTVELKPGESPPLATPIASLPNGRGNARCCLTSAEANWLSRLWRSCDDCTRAVSSRRAA